MLSHKIFVNGVDKNYHQSWGEQGNKTGWTQLLSISGGPI